jgi:6-phosphogluconolactonase
MDQRITGYIGVYTEADFNGRGEGIYSFKLNPASGVLEDLRLCARTVNPSYLALAPGFLYAVNELNEWREPSGAVQSTGAVSAFAVAQDGTLGLINQTASGGTSPCHIALNQAGTQAVVSNYAGGTIAVLPILPGGGLGAASQVIRFSGSGPNRDRQEASHAHSFLFAPDNRPGFASFVGFAFDLGADRVMAYSVEEAAASGAADATASTDAAARSGTGPLTTGPLAAGSAARKAGEFLSPAASPWFASRPGAGPRHGVFHPSGRTAYVINELDSTVDVLGYDPVRGGLTLKQTLSTLPPGVSVANTGAAIRVHPDGTLVYASNRGHDSIAVFKVDGPDRLILAGTTPSGGRTPRDFALDRGGRFLVACHQDSDQVAVFHVDALTGKLEQAGDYAVPSPVCVVLG